MDEKRSRPPKITAFGVQIRVNEEFWRRVEENMARRGFYKRPAYLHWLVMNDKPDEK